MILCTETERYETDIAKADQFPGSASTLDWARAKTGARMALNVVYHDHSPLRQLCVFYTSSSPETMILVLVWSIASKVLRIEG